jgi:hypothetical protein
LHPAIKNMKQLAGLISLAALAVLASCSPGVDMPKGSSKGYQSARLIQRNPHIAAATTPAENQVHGMVQCSLAEQFTSRGMAYGKGDADLVVAYLVIYQESGMTADFRDYFGYGRDVDRIVDVAHTRGVIENKRPDFYRQAGILIDVIDARTNELVYRNFSKGDVVAGASSSARAARIDAAVAAALAGFFR